MSVFSEPLIVNDKQKTFFRFWENKSSSDCLIGQNQKLIFNIKNDFKQIRNFESFCQFPEKQKISEQGMISELLQPILGNQSNLIGKENNSFFLKNEHFAVYNYSEILSNILLKDFVKKLNRIRKFYFIASSWKMNTNQNKFFNNNLMLNILQKIETYISFRIIKYQEYTSLLKFLYECRQFFKEMEFVIDFLFNIVQNQKINILDYFEKVNKKMVKNSFQNVFLMEGFKIATLSSMRIIENISFKNTSLSVLNTNLNIQYTRDSNFNYITFNVPKIYKNIIIYVLMLKQNYHILFDTDEELYQICLATDLQLFKSFDMSHLKKQFELNKKILYSKKEKLNQTILNRLINKKQNQILEKIEKYKKRISQSINFNKQKQVEILNNNFLKLKNLQNQNFLKLQIHLSNDNKELNSFYFNQIENQLMSENKILNIENFFSKQISSKEKEFKKMLTKIQDEKPSLVMNDLDKDILTTLIDQMNYQHESLQKNILQLEEELKSKAIQELNQIEFQELLKGDDNLLEIDFNKLPQINNLELFNHLCSNILKYNSILLDQIVTHIFFENLNFKKFLRIFQLFFFGGEGLISGNIAKRIFSSNGKYKLKNYQKIPIIFDQEIPKKYATFLNFKLKLKKLNPQQEYLVVQNPLNQFIILKGYFVHPLNQFFNDKILDLLFQIFSRILQIQKSDQTLSKNWLMLQKMFKTFPHRKLLEIFASCVRILKQFLFEYKNYIFYFIIEGSFLKLLKKMNEAKSFNEMYKNFIDFLQTVFTELFLNSDNKNLLKQINYLFDVIFKFNSNFKLLEFQEIPDIEHSQSVMINLHKTISQKIKRLLKIMEKSRLYKVNKIWT